VFKTIRLSETERGLLFRDGRFVRVLRPGIYHFLGLPRRVRVPVVSAVTPLVDPVIAHLAAIVANADPAAAEALFLVVTCAADEAAVVSADGVPHAIVRPGTRLVFCRAAAALTVERINLRQTLLVDPRHRALAESMFPAAAVRALVHPWEAGLVFVDGVPHEPLQPGVAVFWTLLHTVEVRRLDQRAQALEVTAQELLTRDRVSVRITLTCFYRITDPAALTGATADHAAALHRLVQFAIRGSLASRTLDEALDARGALDAELLSGVRAGLDVPGLEVDSVNMRDLILPGDMRALLNRVVEAEKTAQANLIRRREETAATRSALNTARLMDDNPTLLRLKELETLERLMEKVERIDLHAGAEGMDALLGLLRARPPAA